MSRISYEPVHTVRDLALVDPSSIPDDRDNELIAKNRPLVAMALRDLRHGLDRLVRELEHAPFAVVFEPVFAKDANGNTEIVAYQELDHGPSLAAASSAYRTIDLAMDDPVNKPVRCHGAIGVDDHRIIRLAHEVNRLKSVLRHRFKPLSNRRVIVSRKRASRSVPTKIPAALAVLRQLEEASLNRLAAYKRIPLIRTNPEKGKVPHPPTPLEIRFTQSFIKSVPRRTVNQLIEEAAATGRDGIVAILEKSGIPGNEYLYVKKEAYPRMRANLTFPMIGPPKIYMGELPILFLLDRKLPPPYVSPPVPRDIEDRRTRTSKPLSDEPIIAKPRRYYRRVNPADREYDTGPADET